MANAVVMPKAGISVESCIIGSWKKNIGDEVKIGDILFDYETDKASFECESTAEGVLLGIFFEDGDEVPCLVNVCAIGENGENISALKPDNENADVETNVVGTNSVRPDEIDSEIPSSNKQFVVSQTKKASFVSPRAKMLAEKLKIDPYSISPTGPNGRVIVRDVETAVNECRNAGMQNAGNGNYSDVKFSGIRKAIAKTMTKSLSEIPQLTHQHSFDATEILNLRKEYKISSDKSGVTLNDMILFAVSRVLKSHEDINAHLINGDTLRKFDAVHLGVAVDTPRGLMVPVIFDADKKSITEISNEMKKLDEAAINGSISPDLLQGATFTISNLGTLGVEMFTPVINPPQVAILGVCGITTGIKSSGKDIEPYQKMGLSFTYDHRAIDGAPASRFVSDLCKELEGFRDIL